MGISGSVQLALDNVLRQGENWSLDWKRNQDASQKIRLSGHFPYLVGLPVGLNGKFELIRQDTSYVNVDWELGLPFHFSPANHISLFLRKRESTVLAPGKDSDYGKRQPYSILLTGLSWNLNQIDSKINPYRGVYLNLEALTGRKQTSNNATYQQTDLQANISYFQPLIKNLTLELTVSSGIHVSDVMLENEGYRLGGVSRLRGFDEDQFMTDAFFIGSLELRYLLDRGSHLVILADQAILKLGEGESDMIIHPAGFGLGGQIKTGGGVFRLIFAVGKLNNQPVSLKNGKIHMGYIAVF
jgi:outer membrane protein assembly factor BamA